MGKNANDTYRGAWGHFIGKQFMGTIIAIVT